MKVSCRIAPWSLKHCKGKSGKVTAKAIKEAVKANPNLEFNEAVSGACLTLSEAREAGISYVNVRFNQDRSVCVLRT